MRRLVLSLLVALALAGPAGAAERAIIILDASGSMWTQIEGKPRIDMARDTLKQVLKGLPSELELGFMSYGHRSKGDCSDIEMMVEPAARTSDAILAAAATLNPKGKTPLSAAVKMAAEALQYTEDKATVILITDGLETCAADPCQLASDLEQHGVDFTTHVVGFGLTDEEGAKVKCLAENTGGTYFSAKDGAGLSKALAETVKQVVAPKPEPVPEPVSDINIAPELVLFEGGKPLSDDIGTPSWEVVKANADGTAGEYVSTEYGANWKGTLAPGDYLITAKLDYAHAEMAVMIEAGKIAKPHFNLNGGHIVIRPRPAEGGEVDDGAAVHAEFPDGNSTTNYGETKLFVPAGDSKIEVSLGNGKADEVVSVAPGEAVEKDMIVGVGHIVFNAFYAQGLAVEEGGLTFNIVSAKKDIQGNREDFGTAYGPDSKFDLPAGDYVARVSMGEAQIEVPFSVKVGEAGAVSPVLEAGVLAISAPGADNIEVFSAQKDIQGNRAAFGNNFAEEANVTLPAGDYHIVVTLRGDGGSKEAEAHVTAGQRTELAVP